MIRTRINTGTTTRKRGSVRTFGAAALVALAVSTSAHAQSATVTSSTTLMPAEFAASGSGFNFDASILPTPWWVRRYDDTDESFDSSIWSSSSRTGALTDALVLGTHTLMKVDSGEKGRWTLSGRAAGFGVRRFESGTTRSGVSFDLKRELLKPESRGSLAFGLGWTLVDDASGATATPWLSLEGRIGLSKRWSLYGQSAWMTDTGDLGALSGDTLEAGLHWQPTPSLSLRAGVRRQRLRLDDGASSSWNADESSSIIFGAGWRW